MIDTMPPRKKTVKPTVRHEPWVVAHADDVTNWKYPPSAAASWFTEEQAKRLAQPGAPDHRWVAMPVADLAYAKPGMSIWDVERVKERAVQEESDAEEVEA